MFALVGREVWAFNIVLARLCFCWDVESRAFQKGSAAGKPDFKLLREIMREFQTLLRIRRLSRSMV